MLSLRLPDSPRLHGEERETSGRGCTELEKPQPNKHSNHCEGVDNTVTFVPRRTVLRTESRVPVEGQGGAPGGATGERGSGPFTTPPGVTTGARRSGHSLLGVGLSGRTRGPGRSLLPCLPHSRRGPTVPLAPRRRRKSRLGSTRATSDDRHSARFFLGKGHKINVCRVMYVLLRRRSRCRDPPNWLRTPVH